jgi:quercetin dioxygenase-like cupin family protein
MKHHGQLRGTAGAAGVYAGHCSGYDRRVLFGRAAGSVHQEVAVVDLDPGGTVDPHVHAFEEAIYVLSGELVLDVAGVIERLRADDYVFVDRGVAHALHNESAGAASWFELNAPQPGAALDDTVFVADAMPSVDLEQAYRRDRFDPADLPQPSATLGLAGFGAANVGGAALQILLGPDTGASQFNLMVVQYAPGGFITAHDHAFEEGFFVLTGELEAELEDEVLTFGPGDYFWSSVGSMHAITNRSTDPVRWLETQAPQPPSRYQARFVADWERFLGRQGP